jgi:hypothetical protein
MLALFICMIKIKLKASPLIKEASVRYLTERYKVPPEFVEFVNNEYRQTADSLIHVFSKSNMFGIAMSFKEDPEKFVNSLKNQFTIFMQDFNGVIVDKLLKKAPKFKKDIISIADESGFNGVIRFAEEKFDVYDLEADKKLTSIRFPDGYYWIDTNKTQCPREAKYMHHCGTAGFGGTLYSLRNKNDKPEVTIEMNAETHEIYQMFHFNNELPPDKYLPYIKKFVEHYQIPIEGMDIKFTHDSSRLMEIKFNIYFDGDKSFDNIIKYLYSIIPKDNESRGFSDNIEKFEGYVKTITGKEDLSVDQYFELFVVFFKATAQQRSASYARLAFESFFAVANLDKKDDQFKLEIFEKAIDYLIANNVFESGYNGEIDFIKSFIQKTLIPINIKPEDFDVEKFKKRIELYKNSSLSKKLISLGDELEYKRTLKSIFVNSQYYPADKGIEFFKKYIKYENLNVEETAMQMLEKFRPAKVDSRMKFVDWLFNEYPELFNSLEHVKVAIKNLIFWSEKDTDEGEEELNKSDIYNKLKKAKEDLKSEQQQIKESRIRIIINSRKY